VHANGEAVELLRQDVRKGWHDRADELRTRRKMMNMAALTAPAWRAPKMTVPRTAIQRMVRRETRLPSQKLKMAPDMAPRTCELV
jgi:hypothetical protein